LVGGGTPLDTREVLSSEQNGSGRDFKKIFSYSTICNTQLNFPYHILTEIPQIPEIPEIQEISLKISQPIPSFRLNFFFSSPF
jgi:hypothetical protein